MAVVRCHATITRGGRRITLRGICPHQSTQWEASPHAWLWARITRVTLSQTAQAKKLVGPDQQQIRGDILARGLMAKN